MLVTGCWMPGDFVDYVEFLLHLLTRLSHPRSAIDGILLSKYIEKPR